MRQIVASRERTLQPVLVGLGAATIAFGAAPFAAPGLFARIFEVPAPDVAVASMMRSIGLRDVVMGAGILLTAARGRNYRPWLLARMVTDAGDVSAIAIAAAQGYTKPRFLALGGLALSAALTEAALYWLTAHAE